MDQPQTVNVCLKTTLPPAIKFNEDVLRRLLLPRGTAVEGETVLIIDYARESNPRNDDSAILAAKIVYDGGVKSYVILGIASDHWPILELPYQIVQGARRHSSKKIWIERLANWPLLSQEISRQAKKYGIDLGHVTFFKPSKKKAAKAERLRRFHCLCESGNVKFAWGNYTEKVFAQLVNFDCESKTNHTRRDDCADVCGLLTSHC
jgi:phage terminase large subunit-like protein